MEVQRACRIMQRRSEGSGIAGVRAVLLVIHRSVGHYFCSPSFSRVRSELLFETLNQRYERGSIIVEQSAFR